MTKLSMDDRIVQLLLVSQSRGSQQTNVLNRFLKQGYVNYDPVRHDRLNPEAWLRGEGTIRFHNDSCRLKTKSWRSLKARLLAAGFWVTWDYGARTITITYTGEEQ